MYPTFQNKLEIIFDKIVFVPLEEKVDHLCLFWLQCAGFNFKTKKQHSAPCLSGSQTPCGRPATLYCVLSLRKNYLSAPIKGKPVCRHPLPVSAHPVCVNVHTCSLASCHRPVPPSPLVPILQLSQRPTGFGLGFGCSCGVFCGSCFLIPTGLTVIATS